MLPWKEISPQSEQERFIEQCQAGEVTFVDACRQFGISRKTGYNPAKGAVAPLDSRLNLTLISATKY